MEKKGLGRGLSALLADVATMEEPQQTAAGPAPSGRAANSIPIERIHPNPNQPRRDFDEKELQDSGGLDPRERHHPAAHPPRSSDADGGVRDRRWRTALAGLAARGPPRTSRARAPAQRHRSSRTRDHREHPACRPQFSGGGPGLSAAHGPLRPHPGAPRRSARQEPEPHRQPPASPDASGRRAGSPAGPAS